MGKSYDGFIWQALGGIFSGTKAFVTQSYVEANAKNGLQYEYSGIGTLAKSPDAGYITNAILKTGAKPVIIKAREIRFNGVGVTAQVFEAPTYTGGTAQPIYNLSRLNPAPTTVQVLTGITLTADGTEISAPTYGVGGTGVGNSTVGTFAVQGAERILKPNTSYLLRITNRDTAAAATVATYATWYEGTPDLPAP